MNVLVDTPVWIRFLQGRLSDAEHLDSLLTDRKVLGHEMVMGELLIGDKGGRTTLLEAYARIDFAPMISNADVIEFVRARKLHGSGVGWIDVHLLASAVVAGVRLWTLDQRLQSLAQKLRIHYELIR